MFGLSRNMSLTPPRANANDCVRRERMSTFGVPKS